MERIKWFDRKFDFANNQQSFSTIVERLEKAPARLRTIMQSIPEDELLILINNAWSIAENIGHLSDLEPLWQGRLEDILNGVKELRPADLNNTKTDSANHNERTLNELLDEFTTLRQQTITNLKELKEEDIQLSALHPRLKTPMRTIDLFFFVAEHDDHHLNRIVEIHEWLVGS